MAEAVVGGAFLSAFLNVIFERLSSSQFLNLIQGKKLDQELLERLKITLYAIQAVLNDAEHKEINEPAVKNWLDDLRDAVYVADDLLDRVSTKAATQKEVSNFLSIYLNLRDRKVANKIKDITRKLEYIVKYKDILGLKEIARENFSWRTPSTSLLEGSNFYGRTQDKEAIIQLLLDDNSEGNISVIPVVGMGGVGKTTLAQSIYNDENLMKKFDLKVWVCVSEEFDIVKVTKTVIEAITSSGCNTKDLNLLQLDLKTKLTGKIFFVVLDDIWNDDYDGWNSLKKPFQYGIKGSKILVTTRSKKVASIVQTCPPYHLNELSDTDCWSLFADHACFLRSNGNPTLEKIGRDIVKKCKGLPLAVQTLGGLLRAKRDIKDWNAVLTSEIWELSANDSKIIPALRISYHHLPPHLKRCFVYCSLFPKDYKFDKDELILLWMAEGLLEQPKQRKNLEEVGSECFDDLASRLFFKQLEIDDVKSFVMHDLMHDLAISLGGDFYFRSEELGKEDRINVRTRHLSYGRLTHPKKTQKFDAIGKLKSLRTFMKINVSTSPFMCGSEILILLLKFKYLRVLSFCSFEELEVVPDSIGNLIHLHYWDLSETSIKTLPESLSNLYNLQTLKLYRCKMLTMLPSGMQNLVNLRHLNVIETDLKRMPQGISKLKHLQILSDFVVSEHEENGMSELGELSNLHKSLCIRKLENVTSSDEAQDARIMDKIHIEDLFLEWSLGSDLVTTSAHTEKEILDKLQPHKGLKVVRIKRYRGTSFANWLGNSSYHNMTRVSLESCSKCCSLPSLGQLPSLKSLEIADFNVLESIGIELYKNDNDSSSSIAPFSSLEYLSFDKMSCWEVWHSSESDAFPQLKELRISGCNRLRGELPNHLPALKTLVIESCKQLVSSLPKAPAIHELRINQSNLVGLQEFPISLHSLSKCLKTLGIWNCEKLEFPKQQHELLEYLKIFNSCNSLTSFPLEAFPNLQHLDIDGFENLESISVPQSHVPNSIWFHNMTVFRVSKCYKLKSLPCHMNTLFPNLGSLAIINCPEIDSFPEEVLPPNLTSLEIWNCEKLLNRLSSMSVHRSLTNLSIGGGNSCESVSFPNEGLLPQLPFLGTLLLIGLKNMEILDCKGLLHLNSRQLVGVVDCSKLKNMTGERLPPSLIRLEMYRVPLLGKRCQDKHVQIWPKISHVHEIRVDGRWIV